MNKKILSIDWDTCPRCKSNLIRIGSDMSKGCLWCYREDLE